MLRTGLTKRSTPDIIVMWLSGLVGFVIVTATIGGIIWKIVDPSADLKELVVRLTTMINTLIGVIAGYLAGRNVVTIPDPESGTNN